MGAAEGWRAFWSRYFAPKAFERAGQGRVYRVLGIRLFKRYLPTSGDLVSRRRGVRHLDAERRGLLPALLGYERTTRSYEARHIFGGLSMLALSWWAVEARGRGSWPALLVANVLLNGYPIMLQRYNRVRLRAALARLQARPPLCTRALDR